LYQKDVFIVSFLKNGKNAIDLIWNQEMNYKPYSKKKHDLFKVRTEEIVWYEET
jgi:hypothetical protein